MLRAALVLLGVALCACGQGRQSTPLGSGGSGPPAALQDTDDDGLCDLTEDLVVSDPGRPDTDGDGVPDLFEYLLGYGIDNPLVPEAAHLPTLAANAGAQLDFDFRVTVDGEGEGHAGAFSSLPSPYPELSAEDFFVAALASSAQPPDHVRDVSAEDERFGAVLGETRLSFELRFAHDAGEPAHDGCVRGYPFRYAVKADGASGADITPMLLRTVPPGAAADAPYCLPARCL